MSTPRCRWSATCTTISAGTRTTSPALRCCRTQAAWAATFLCVTGLSGSSGRRQRRVRERRQSYAEELEGGAHMTGMALP